MIERKYSNVQYSRIPNTNSKLGYDYYVTNTGKILRGLERAVWHGKQAKTATPPYIKFKELAVKTPYENPRTAWVKIGPDMFNLFDTVANAFLFEWQGLPEGYRAYPIDGDARNADISNIIVCKKKGRKGFAGVVMKKGNRYRYYSTAQELSIALGYSKGAIARHMRGVNDLKVIKKPGIELRKLEDYPVEIRVKIIKGCANAGNIITVDTDRKLIRKIKEGNGER